MFTFPVMELAKPACASRAPANCLWREQNAETWKAQDESAAYTSLDLGDLVFILPTPSPPSPWSSTFHLDFFPTIKLQAG